MPPLSLPDDRLKTPTPRLSTGRLVLRPVLESDAPTIQRRFPKWEIVRHLAAVVPWPYPEDGAITHIRRSLQDMAVGGRWVWAITRVGNEDDAIGLIDLRASTPQNRENRGFWLDPDFWGLGLMTEAAEAVTAFAFEVLDWSELWLSNAENNVASARVKEKQGAELIAVEPSLSVEGPGRKMVWRLDREVWRARRSDRVS